MKKYLAVVTARASYSRFRLALLALNNSTKAEVGVVLAAAAAKEECGNVQRQLCGDNLKLVANIDSLSDNDSYVGMTDTVSEIVRALGEVILSFKPDGIIVIADRYETISVSIAAVCHRIPLIHIQGGEVTGNIDEKIRHANTKLADFHLVSTERAKEYLIRMGENPDCVCVTGCPSCDIAREVMDGWNDGKRWTNEMLSKYFSLDEEDRIKNNSYLVFLYHPVTYSNEYVLEQLEEIKNAAINSGKLIIWFMPNQDVGNQTCRAKILEYVSEYDQIISCNAMDNMDFLELLLNSEGIVGNSSVGVRECSFMGVPAVNIGDRQNGREKAINCIDTECNAEAILVGIAELKNRKGQRSMLYGDGYASQKICTVLEGCNLTNNKTLQYVYEEHF